MPVTEVRLVCAWCEGPIPANARVDSVTCSKRCRQGRWRFLRDVDAGTRGTDPLRFAYADPPYIGLSKRHYGEHPDYAGEVDHAALIAALCTFDGWALSCSARSLPQVLALCPPGVRIGAWVRGERPTRHNGPLSAWEPVVYAGGRAITLGAGDTRRVDTLIHAAKPRLTDPKRVMGAKPAMFCRWLFADLLGAQRQDTLADLFPGSGGVGRAWEAYCRDELPAARRDASRKSVADLGAT